MCDVFTRPLILHSTPPCSPHITCKRAVDISSVQPLLTPPPTCAPLLTTHSLNTFAALRALRAAATHPSWCRGLHHATTHADTTRNVMKKLRVQHRRRVLCIHRHPVAQMVVCFLFSLHAPGEHGRLPNKTPPSRRARVAPRQHPRKRIVLQLLPSTQCLMCVYVCPVAAPARAWLHELDTKGVRSLRISQQTAARG
jgi:ferredoxin